MATSFQTLRSVATLARNRAASFEIDTGAGLQTPSCSTALVQIATDLDAAAAFLSESPLGGRLGDLLREAVELADCMGLDIVAAHAALAADTLRRDLGQTAAVAG